MSGKRSRSFKCAVHHRDGEVSSACDFHLLRREAPRARRMARLLADHFLTDERDRKYYADHYSCCPPPLFLISVCTSSCCGGWRWACTPPARSLQCSSTSSTPWTRDRPPATSDANATTSRSSCFYATIWTSSFAPSSVGEESGPPTESRHKWRSAADPSSLSVMSRER